MTVCAFAHYKFNVVENLYRCYCQEPEDPSTSKVVECVWLQERVYFLKNISCSFLCCFQLGPSKISVYIFLRLLCSS